MKTARRTARIRVDLSAWDTAPRAAERHADAELSLLAMVLSNVKANAVYAKRLGLTPALFTQYDLRLIWCACDLASRYGLANVLRLARRALQADGYWAASDRRSFGRGPLWSSIQLVGLCGEWLPRSAARALPGAVADLQRVHGLMSESMRLQRQAAELMSRAADRAPGAGNVQLVKAG